MFQRAISTLGSHVQTPQDTGSFKIHTRIDSNSNSLLFETPESVEDVPWKSGCSRIFAAVSDINVSLFPIMTRICSEAAEFSKFTRWSLPGNIWPPDARSMGRGDWIMSTTYSILPRGSESKVALARVNFPLVHLRIPIMGRGYLTALSILSESSHTIEEFRLDERWYLPDIEEFVNFPSDKTHTYS